MTRNRLTIDAAMSALGESSAVVVDVTAALLYGE
jgi:hypothetical protein